jgi:hypothetical protein
MEQCGISECFWPPRYHERVGVHAHIKRIVLESDTGQDYPGSVRLSD